jgi:hypothetical protein
MGLWTNFFRAWLPTLFVLVLQPENHYPGHY